MTTHIDQTQVESLSPKSPLSAPPSQLHSPSLTRSPLLGGDGEATGWSGHEHARSLSPWSPVSGPPSMLHSPSLTRSPLLGGDDVVEAPRWSGPARRESTQSASPSPPISAPPSIPHSPPLTRSPLLGGDGGEATGWSGREHSRSLSPWAPISAPPSMLHSPSLTRSPLLGGDNVVEASRWSGTARRESTRSASPRPPISAPPSMLHSPSLTRSPLLGGDRMEAIGRNATPRARTPRVGTPMGSPLVRALKLTKLHDPHDAWLPITESRNGNAFYAAFHTLCSGIGIQALVLPVAFTVLGWTWGIIFLTATFAWQLYTLYLLVHLHESPQTGMRYSRYLQLFSAAFGEKLSNWFAAFPILYLSGGTCVALIIVGGSTSRMLYQTLCGGACASLTAVEWYLVFTSATVVLSQLPNLNSIAGVSLIGAAAAVGYCTVIWVVSVSRGRLPSVSYDPVLGGSDIAKAFGVLNALGIIAFAFRGHNLVLEIQATMPSDEKHPSHVPMWKGVKVAYFLIAGCLFPLAIGGYWAYGQMIPENGGMLTALYAFHGRDTSRVILGSASSMVIINALGSFQIYGMPIFDMMESVYTRKMKKACPWWLRAASRAVFGYMCFFVAVAIPFLSSVAGLVGGVALPVTLAYPCFLWIKVKKPKPHGPAWWINWALGVLGMCLSGFLVAAGVYSIIKTGIKVSFFDPQ